MEHHHQHSISYLLTPMTIGKAVEAETQEQQFKLQAPIYNLIQINH